MCHCFNLYLVTKLIGIFMSASETMPPEHFDKVYSLLDFVLIHSRKRRKVYLKTNLVGKINATPSL